MSNPVCFLHNPPTFPRFPAPPQARPRRKPPLSSSSLFPSSPPISFSLSPPPRCFPSPPTSPPSSFRHLPISSAPSRPIDPTDNPDHCVPIRRPPRRKHPQTGPFAPRPIDHHDDPDRKPAHFRPNPSTTPTTLPANQPPFPSRSALSMRKRRPRISATAVNPLTTNRFLQFRREPPSHTQARVASAHSLNRRMPSTI